MPEPAKIRNVAVVGHRGTGKTVTASAAAGDGQLRHTHNVHAATAVLISWGMTCLLVEHSRFSGSHMS
jgi:hypothetical protein